MTHEDLQWSGHSEPIAEFAAFGSPFRAWCSKPTNHLGSGRPYLSMARPSLASRAGGSGAGAQPGSTPERTDLIRSTRPGQPPPQQFGQPGPTGEVGEGAGGGGSGGRGLGGEGHRGGKFGIAPAPSGNACGAGQFAGRGTASATRSATIATETGEVNSTSANGIASARARIVDRLWLTTSFSFGSGAPVLTFVIRFRGAVTYRP